MTVRHSTATIPKGELASANSRNQKEGSVMRIMRIRSWFLGICVALYISVFATPANASVETITKVCPDAAVTAGPNQILGVAWGYAEFIGVFLLIGSGLALLCVAAIPRLRAKVTGSLVFTLILVLGIGTFITIVTTLPGTSC